MNKLLDLIAPYWRIIELVLIGAVLLAVAWWIHSYGEGRFEQGKKDTELLWSKERERQKDEAIQDGITQARETLRRLNQQKENDDAQQREREASAAAHRRADAADERVREQSRELAASARGACSNTATSEQRQAGTSSIDLLADMQRRADQRAGELAAYADDARERGLLCERNYDALTKGH